MRPSQFLITFVLSFVSQGCTGASNTPRLCSGANCQLLPDQTGSCQGERCLCQADAGCACGTGSCSFDCVQACTLACQPGSTCTVAANDGLSTSCVNASCQLSGGERAKVGCSSSTCTGTLGADAQVGCSAGSCTLTVARGAKVGCAGGSCDITCTATCDVGCAPGTQCVCRGPGCTLGCADGFKDCGGGKQVCNRECAP